jgi:hypothetical protein
VNKPAHSLTHIAFAGDVVHSVGSPFETFINLRFPNLRSLELGTLVNDSMRSVPYAETTFSTTLFVSAHNLLEHLSLGKRAPKEGQRTFHLDGALITPDFLPHLRSLEGCPRTVTFLVLQRVRSIFSLVFLSLIVGTMEDQELSDLSSMSSAIKSSQARSMLTVRDLKVEFTSITSVHKVPLNEMSVIHRRCLDAIADVCPGVVNWSGNLPAMKAVSICLSTNFSPRCYDHS